MKAPRLFYVRTSVKHIPYIPPEVVVNIYKALAVSIGLWDKC